MVNFPQSIPEPSVTLTKYIPSEKERKELGDCAICLNPLNDRVKTLIRHNDSIGVKHPFHKSCIDEYLHFRQEAEAPCPFCQVPIKVINPDKIQDIGLGVLATGATLATAVAINQLMRLEHDFLLPATLLPGALFAMAVIPTLAKTHSMRSHIINGASNAAIFTMLTGLYGCSLPVSAAAAVAGGILGFGISSNKTLSECASVSSGIFLGPLAATMVAFDNGLIALGSCTIASAAGGAVASLAKRFFRW